MNRRIRRFYEIGIHWIRFLESNIQFLPMIADQITWDIVNIKGKNKLFSIIGGAQISAILGPCAGGACYLPALTDFIFMVKEKSHMFVTGPDVVKAVTHEEVTKEDLGGAYTHISQSGVAHFMNDTEEETLTSIRELLSFLPSNNMEDVPVRPLQH